MSYFLVKWKLEKKLLVKLLLSWNESVWDLFFLTVSITRHPEDQSVSTGENIDFHIEATGNDVLQFQWQKDGKIIDNHDPRFFCKKTNRASTLHISCVKKHDEGYYKCLVTEYAFEKSGKASSEAKLIVCKSVEFFVSLSLTIKAPIFPQRWSPSHEPKSRKQVSNQWKAFTWGWTYRL